MLNKFIKSVEDFNFLYGWEGGGEEDLTCGKRSSGSKTEVKIGGGGTKDK